MLLEDEAATVLAAAASTLAPLLPPEDAAANGTGGEQNMELGLYVRKNIRNLVPIICLVGIVGNCMALMLIRTNFWLRRLTSNIYLCTLSLCGCGFLVMVLATWTDQMYSVPLYNHSEIGCKLFTFIAHFCDFICVWMISWISCDRMILLYRPGIRKYVCTKKFARRLTLSTVAVAILLYGWCLIVAGTEQVETERGMVPFCGVVTSTTLFGFSFTENFFLGHLILDTVICTIVPSILIMFWVVNCFSTYRYRQCMKIYSSGVLRVRFLRSPDTDMQIAESTTAKKLLLSQAAGTNNNAGGTSSQLLSSAPATSTRTGPAHCGKLRSSDLQLSRSLLVVTSTFVLLNVPNYVARTIEFLFTPKSSFFSMFNYITYMMYYLHHAVLFYMYIFWSPQMKKQLRPTAVRLLECYCFKTVPEFGHRSTSLQQFNRG